MKKESVESRALTIAAKIMTADGLCRYEDESMCHLGVSHTQDDCDRCIREWLIQKARLTDKQIDEFMGEWE